MVARISRPLFGERERDGGEKYAIVEYISVEKVFIDA